MKKKITIIIGVVIILLVIAILLLINGVIIPNELKANEYEIKGVDVSEYQGEIDWKILSSQGIDFAFIKATEGSSYKDSYFTKNYEQLKKTNLLIGVYHFFSFESSGENQANNYINTVGSLEDDELILPIIDIEFYGDKEKNLPDNESTKKELQVLLNKIEEKYKVKPVIYTTQKFYNLYIKDNFKDYELWIRNIISFPKLQEGQNWTFWQYTNRKKLNGYNGKEKFIDMNVFNGTRKEFNDYIWNKKQTRKEKIEEERIKEEEEEAKKTKQIRGKITKIEENTFLIEDENEEIKKVTIPDSIEIINKRTEGKMEIKDIKENDDIFLSKAKVNENEIVLEGDCYIEITRNLTGEELKQELLNQKEINASIKEIKNNTRNNEISLICEIQDYFTPEQEVFEITILANKNTKILASTENQLENLKMIKQTGNNIFIKLNEKEKQKGKLVAENIEAMGC